jgi:Mg2+ and Co2+ transporter CorA
LFNGFLKIKKLKINLNINGGLTELLVKKGYSDIIKLIYELAKSKRLEFTESAKYHPLLPLLTKEEIERQIIENRKTNKKYFDPFYQPKCFFPPELAFHPKIGEIVAKLGYSMMILDEIAYPGKPSDLKESVFKLKGRNQILVFRERRISNCLMSALIKNEKEFHQILGEDLKKKIYLLTGIDGETFGHHRPGLEKSLFKIVSSKTPKQIFLSEIPKYFKVRGEVLPRICTWASSLDEIEKGLQFYSWRDPKNKIHQLQWKFLKYLRSLISKRKVSKRTIEKYDEAISSDQFFWASGEPWWSLEMIEKGAFKLLRL